MSVTLHVGYLDEMRRCDEEGFARYRKFFREVTKMLKAHCLPPYKEPEQLNGTGRWWQVSPSNGIAYLQRLGVYLWQKKELPSPGTEEVDNPLEDENIEAARENCYLDQLGLNDKGQRFNHLVCHSCRDDYWLPVDFDEVILENEIQYGSSIQLKNELEDIAEWLKLPLDLDPTDSSVQQTTRQGSRTSRTRWKKYRIEAMNCLLLHSVAKKSIELGAAIKLH
jgi:hypothetical protein